MESGAIWSARESRQPGRRQIKERVRCGYLVHVGSGVNAPRSWVNLDGSWNVWVSKVPFLRRVLASLRLISWEAARYPWPRNVRYHNVARGLPLPGGSAVGIYASHVVEHLSREAARRFLEECWRVLVPGGFLRLVVPDLAALVGRYAEERLADSAGEGPADRFMERLNTCPDSDGLPLATRVYRGLNDVIRHKWMYDEASLVHALRTVGFCEIETKGYLDSRIPLISDVERRESFELAFCVEGMRPELT